MKKLQIGVIGSAGPEEYPLRKPNQKMYDSAREVGEILARKNCIIVCGGKGGIMEAVCLGAKKENGVTVAEVAGEGRFEANEFVDVEIVTQDTGFRGASQLIGMSDGLIALGGGAGTLQEIAIAYRMKKPLVLLVGFGGWVDRIAKLGYLDERQLVHFKQTNSSQEAVRLLLALLQPRLLNQPDRV